MTKILNDHCSCPIEHWEDYPIDGFCVVCKKYTYSELERRGELYKNG